MLSSLLIYCKKKKLCFTSRNPRSLSIFLSKSLKLEVMPEKSQKWLCTDWAAAPNNADFDPKLELGFWSSHRNPLPNLKPDQTHRIIPEYAHSFNLVSDVFFSASECEISVQIPSWLSWFLLVSKHKWIYSRPTQ